MMTVTPGTAVSVSALGCLWYGETCRYKYFCWRKKTPSPPPPMVQNRWNNGFDILLFEFAMTCVINSTIFLIIFSFILLMLIILFILFILTILIHRFASITINLGPTFLSGALAANLDDHVHEPSCPIVQVRMMMITLMIVILMIRVHTATMCSTCCGSWSTCSASPSPSTTSTSFTGTAD